MNQPVLQAIDLHCQRQDRVLFRQLNFSLEAGQALQIEGPNGSGKTTLLRALCGLSQRYEGEFLWRGQSVKTHRAAFFQDLLYLGHRSGVKAELTPLENLQWSCDLQSRGDSDRIINALARVGLAGYEESLCYSLSAGQLRRVNLARLFLSEAALWVLDEPFTAIDSSGTAELESWIDAHLSAGGLVILTSHQRVNLSGRLDTLNLQSYAADLSDAEATGS